MAALSTSTFAYALKRLYTKEKIKDTVYQQQPALAILPKMEDFGGDYFVIPVKYSKTGGRAATFSVAQSNKSAAGGVAFRLSRVKDYSLASIDSETILASQGDEKALLRAVKSEMDSAINALRLSIGRELFGDGSGKIGVIDTTVNSTTLTLTNADDITNFEKGDKIVFAANTSSALRTTTAATVNSVDRDAGTMVLSATPTSLSGQSGDSIFIEGDYDSASDTNKISGFKAWLPDSAPGATTFFNVARNVDAVRLGGCRVDGSSLPIDEGLYKLATRIGRENGTPDHCFLSFEKFEELQMTLGAKVQYEDLEVGAVGFKALVLNAPTGMIKVLPDRNCPKSNAYMITLDTWKLCTLGPAVRILDLDGLQMQRESTADAYEFRIVCMGNLGCSAPGWNGTLHSMT